MSTQQTDRFYGVSGGLAVKSPCVAATTSNITLSGLQTIGTVVLAAGDRVLVAAQTDKTENGIYIASTTAWQRAADFDGNRDVVPGTMIVVGDAPISARPPDFYLAYWARTDAEESAGIADYSPSNPMGGIINPEYVSGDVRRYGAVADGSTDCYLAFQAALDQNVQSDNDSAAIYSPNETYIINTGLTWCANGEDDRMWRADGTKLRTDNDINLLTVGSIGQPTRANNCQITGQLKLKSNIGLPTVTGTGFLVQQCGSCEFNIGVEDFYYGIRLTADTNGYGVARNTFNLGYMNKNYYGVGIVLTSAVGTFANANRFYGGYFSFKPEDIGYHIYIPRNASGTTSSERQPNDNNFYHCMLEGGDSLGLQGFAQGAVYCDGRYNSFYQCRVEIKPKALANDPDPKQVFFGENSGKNFWLWGWATKAQVTGADNNEIDDQGAGNLIFAGDTLLMRGQGTSDAGKLMLLQRQKANESDLPVQHIRDLYIRAGNDEPSMGLLTSLANESNASGYHHKAETTGSIVWKQLASGTYQHYECIQAHTSSAGVNEPGTAGGEAFWELLNADEATGGTPLAAAEWQDATGYVAASNIWMVKSDGSICTNQRSANTNTPSGATAYQLPVYDEDGNNVGYIPVYGSAW
jgi:hypothetical protein